MRSVPRIPSGLVAYALGLCILAAMLLGSDIKASEVFKVDAVTQDAKLLQHCTSAFICLEFLNMPPASIYKGGPPRARCMAGFKEAAELEGEAIQWSRYANWIVETDSAVRVELLTQWIAGLRFQGFTLNADSLTSSVLGTLRFCGIDEVKKRKSEILLAYAQSNRKRERIVPDEALGAAHYSAKTWAPFLSKSFPLGNIIFTGDIGLIRRCFTQTLINRGLQAEPIGVPHYDCQVGDLAIARILNLPKP